MIADGDRPYRALAVTAVFVAIVQRDFPSFVNLRARPRHVDAVRFLLPGRTGAAGGFKHERSQAFGDGVGDFRNEIVGGAGQGGIGMAGDPLRAKHGRFDLIGGEHQGRQVKSLLQNITHAGLTADRHALFDQGRDVAVDRPLRGLQLGRDRICRQWFAGAPEHLNDLEQPVGTSHGRLFLRCILADADSMLAAGGQYTGTTLQPRGFCP